MRGRIGVMIGLDLDDDAADAVHQHRRANQIGSDFMHAAGKERTLELPAKTVTGSARHNSVRGNAALSHSRGLQMTGKGLKMRRGCQYAKGGGLTRRAVAIPGQAD